MHVLMTADTVGGVWTYTRELVTGLCARGVRVTLVSFGAIPTDDQVAWVSQVDGLDYRPTSYRLEWMQDSHADLDLSRNYLSRIVREVRPDLIHSNQYAFGDLSSKIPCIVVAHSDVVSWWVSVHGEEPPESEWMRRYRDTVTRGIRAASAVVAPSQWMLEAIRSYYLHPGNGRVIYNGVPSQKCQYSGEKQPCVLTVGRLWDKAKQVSLLMQYQYRVPVLIVGSEDHPEEQRRENTALRRKSCSLQFLGRRSQAELEVLYGRASIYAATACYEPFGLAPLEAALAGCALVANDIPVFHELWGDSAYYFRRNDPVQLAKAIETLASDADLSRKYGQSAHQHATSKFSVDKMCDEYQQLYCTLISQGTAA